MFSSSFIVQEEDIFQRESSSVVGEQAAPRRNRLEAAELQEAEMKMWSFSFGRDQEGHDQE